jgi:hypothetical protein
MKNFVLTTLILSILWVSCKKEKFDPAANAIKVTAQKSGDNLLKTAYDNATVKWIEGIDQIGLFSDRAYTTAPGNLASNVSYTAQATNSNANFSSPTTIYYDGSSNVHKFYAYYPYQSGSFLVSGVPVSLPSAQAQVGTQTTHIGALDFEIAKPLSLTPSYDGSNPEVNLIFNHAFTILKFDLTCDAGNDLSSISVTTSALPALSLNTGSTIDISQAEPAPGEPYIFNVLPGGTPLNVTLYANLRISTTVASAYMLILPGDATANTITLKYTASSGKIFTVTRPGTKFERGKIYTITQNIPTVDAGSGNW